MPWSPTPASQTHSYVDVHSMCKEHREGWIAFEPAAVVINSQNELVSGQNAFSYSNITTWKTVDRTIDGKIDGLVARQYLCQAS